jgi:hypothetical protein
MIDINEIKVIPPFVKMPKPGQFFLMAVQESSGMKLYPAVPINYATPETFYAQSKVLNREGEAVNGFVESAVYLGWVELFPNTKCYTITEVTNDKA